MQGGTYMDKNTNKSTETDRQESKKKQKAGLNAIRPDDYTEQKFKTMAREKQLSQTEFFERIFWDYLSRDKQEMRNEALNCEGEINLIAKDLENILNHFKSIVDKAQNKVITVTSNSEQTIGNLKLEIDTLQKKCENLEIRNAELEKTNGVFTEVKADLEKQIQDLAVEVEKRAAEIVSLKESNKDKDRSIKELEKQLSLNEKEINSLKQENLKLQDEVTNKSILIRNLEVTCSGLQSSVERIETLKKAEIEAIEARNQATVSQLQNKINSIEENLRSEMEAEKKLAMADIILELAQTKERLAELLSHQGK